MPASSDKERLSTVPDFSLAFLLPQYWLVWFGLSLFYCLSWMPAALLDRLGDSIGNRVARKNQKRFHIANRNLSLCFPDKSEAEIKQMVIEHFRAQARATLQYAKLWWQPESVLKESIDVVGLDQVRAVTENGGHAIILLCHSVSLDVAIAAISMRIRSSGPYKPFRNKLLDWLVENRRIRFGGIIFTRDDGLRPIIKSIRSGRVLIYPADEDLGAGRCIFAPFYGVQKATVPVLGRLAKTTGSKVFTCMPCYDREQSKYIVNILPSIEGIDGEDDLEDTKAMNASVEKAVAVCPTQYMWTLRLFKTRPEGESSVYE